MLKHENKLLVTFLVSIMMAFTIAPAFASGGDGTGGGDGKNRDIPLTLKSCSIENNSEDVPVNPTIQLNFSKNICNITVLPNNKMCFHLSDSQGNSVAIKLIFPDDQVQKKYKREMVIQPVENLEPFTEYRIAVDSTLAAKNGTTIDNAHTVSFTTGDKTTDSQNKMLEKLGDFTTVYETSAGENANSIPVNKEGLDEKSRDSLSTGSVAFIAGGIFLLLIIGFTVVVIIIKRRK